ncbi:MAG: ATP-binding protein, partial [Gammaproteobacteria bacterium]|nr:ATP-binding protein [Gammaproteobacteria bacterium]
ALRHDLRGAQPAPRLVVDQTLSQAIANILNNAADASPHDVEVIGRWSDTELTLEIADRGPGLAPEAGRRAGEALFTTKHEGLGLGLFLTYATLRRLGGEVRLLDRDGGGMRCRLTLPLAPVTVP